MVDAVLTLYDLRFSQCCCCCWGIRSSGMWHCVYGQVVPDLMKDNGGQAVQLTKNWTTWLLKMKAPWWTDTSETSQPTAECHIPEGLNPVSA